MVRGQGRGLVNWSLRVLEDKDFSQGQQHCQQVLLFIEKKKKTQNNIRAFLTVLGVAIVVSG